MAAGTPIVASTMTPWEEVEEANCGKWVDNTVDATANAMAALLGKDRKVLQRNSQQYIQKFSWKNIAKEMKKLYERII